MASALVGFADTIERVSMLRIDSLTDEQLAGQCLMVGFNGEALDDELRFMISQMHVGGLILFRRNISDPLQLGQLCQAVQAFAADSGNPPLMIAVDQEGGPVSRLGAPFTVFPGNRAIGEAGSETAAREFGTITAEELKGVGITMNLAPVLDVIPHSGSVPLVMADRVLGKDPRLVANLGKTIIEGLQEHGVAATAKHFPGMGRATIDPHSDLPHVDVERHVLDSTDLVPFQAAIRRGVEAVMLSHVVYGGLDPAWPASLSSVIAKDLLRDTMGFEGVTMTDDLDMGAVERHFGVNTVMSRICHAEIDIALICHDQAKIEEAYRALLKAIGQSWDTKRKRVSSVLRILNLKENYPGWARGLAQKR